MNEQALADLLSEHIDRLLAGELNAEVPAIADLPELVALGQNLSQITFQPGPAAQATFQSQVDQWFGSETLPASKVFKLPTGLSGSIAIVMGLIIAVGSIFLGGSSEAEQLEPAVTQPVVSPPEIAVTPTPATPIRTPVPVTLTQTPVSTTPTPASLQPTNSLGDSLPAIEPSFGETLPLATPAVSSPRNAAPTSISGDTSSDNVDDDPSPADQPGESSTGDNPTGQGNNDGLTQGDHDRGHGNDPGRFDQDNPGQGGSGKPSSGNDGKGSGKGGGKGGGKKGK